MLQLPHSLFGTGTSTFGQTPATGTGFGGFGTSQAGDYLQINHRLELKLLPLLRLEGFPTLTQVQICLLNHSLQRIQDLDSTQPLDLDLAELKQPFGAAKPKGFGQATTATPSFNFASGNTAGTSMFGSELNKPGTLGTFGTSSTKGFGGFNAANAGLGVAPSLRGTLNETGANEAAQVQQTLIALSESMYGDAPPFWKLKDSKTKQKEVLKPTNPDAQKALLVNQQKKKVSPRPMAKIRTNALSGALNGSKLHVEGSEEDYFSFGSDTFQPRKIVMKLTIKKVGQDSYTPSRASSVNGEPQNVYSVRHKENIRGRSSPVAYNEERRQEVPETETIIRSKGISDQMADTPDRRPNIDDNIAILNSQNKFCSNREPVSSSVREPVSTGQDVTVNISIISRDESNDDVIEERPELRLEDYAAGRKGKHAGATLQPIFGQAKPSRFRTLTGFDTTTSTGGGLFGQQTPQAASTGEVFSVRLINPCLELPPPHRLGLEDWELTLAQELWACLVRIKKIRHCLVLQLPHSQACLVQGLAHLVKHLQQEQDLVDLVHLKRGDYLQINQCLELKLLPLLGLEGFPTLTLVQICLLNHSLQRIQDLDLTQPLDLDLAELTQPFGAAKPTGFGQTTTATPSFNFAAGNTAGTSMFGSEWNKPETLGTFGTSSTTGFGGFNAANTGLGVAPSLGGTLKQTGANEAAQVQQTLIALSDSLFGDSPLFWNFRDSFGGFNGANTGLVVAPSFGGTLNQTGANEAAQVQQTQIALSESMYGDSPLFWNLKDSKIKREEVLKPTNPDAQKALLANQHQVSPRPMAKIRSKALSGALNCCKNMTLLMWLWILLAVLLPCTFTRGEDIVIVTDNAPCIVGTKHTLTCEMRRRTSVVKWLNGIDGKPIVYSYNKNCLINSAYERKYNHACDLAKNIFNLTILKVTKDDNGKKLVCSDGSKSGCKIITLGEYEQRLDDSGNGIITAISACSSDKNVLFKWIKIDHNGEEVEFNPIILNKTETICLDECGNSRNMKYTENIFVASSGIGRKYHLKVAVFYGAVRIVSNETRVAYMIEEQAAEPKYEDSSESVVAVIAAVAAAVVVAGVIAVVVMFCMKRVIRLFHTSFNRVENPINREERSENWEERPFNLVDTQAGLQEPEAKIEENVELMIKTVNGDSNKGSDNGTPSVNPEEDQGTEFSLPKPDFY